MGNPDAEPRSPVPVPPTGGPVGAPAQMYTETSPAEDQPPPPHQVQPAPWSVHLLDCSSDFRRFCISLWCPCITFGQISEIIDRGSSSCARNGARYFFTACPGYGCINSCIHRTRMQGLYQLEGDYCKDFAIHLICEPCALTQMYLELQNQGFDVSIGWQGNVERQTQGVAMMPPIVEGGMRR